MQSKGYRKSSMCSTFASLIIFECIIMLEAKNQVGIGHTLGAKSEKKSTSLCTIYLLITHKTHYKSGRNHIVYLHSSIAVKSCLLVIFYIAQSKSLSLSNMRPSLGKNASPYFLCFIGRKLSNSLESFLPTFFKELPGDMSYILGVQIEHYCTNLAGCETPWKQDFAQCHH